MSSEVESSANAVSKSSDEDLKKLESDYRVLQEEAQSLINDRAHLEAEVRGLKKRANTLN